MFIELVEVLRCIAAHEDTWLVASADRLEDRRIIEGTLGCPTCRASYPIRDGITWLGASPGAELPVASTVKLFDAEHEALRLEALLDLREPGMRALVAGELGRLAHLIAADTRAELLVVDPPDSVRSGDGVSVVRTNGLLPVASASMRAVALDDRFADVLAPLALSPALAALRDGGRLVAPASTPVPDEASELARDARQWVAARRARPSAPVQLTLVRGGRGAS